jgi:hypothetical protein
MAEKPKRSASSGELFTDYAPGDLGRVESVKGAQSGQA